MLNGILGDHLFIKKMQSDQIGLAVKIELVELEAAN